MKNADSSPTTGEKYRKEAEKKVAQEKKNAAFLVGDFNAVFTGLTKKYERILDVKWAMIDFPLLL